MHISTYIYTYVYIKCEDIWRYRYVSYNICDQYFQLCVQQRERESERLKDSYLNRFVFQSPSPPKYYKVYPRNIFFPRSLHVMRASLCQWANWVRYPFYTHPALHPLLLWPLPSVPVLLSISFPGIQVRTHPSSLEPRAQNGANVPVSGR